MNRSYTYHGMTKTLCPACLEVIDGKIVIEKNSVYILGHCQSHGDFKLLREKDASWYLNRYAFDKAGTITLQDTATSQNCPHDCGICPEHDQHTCIGLIEITSDCNLECDMCYASCEEAYQLDMDTISLLLDYYQEAEGGNAEILQISGGEPTLHPNVIDIIRLAREKDIKYVMLNTNGIRIAEDETFVQALSEFKGRFEIYLQFDSLKDDVYTIHRGKPLLEVKLKAIENLKKYEIPVTLVTTVSKDNMTELGQLTTFAMETEYIRGINYQPMAQYHSQVHDIDKMGSMQNWIDHSQALTLTDIMGSIEKQTAGIVKMSDFVPLPCNVERIAVSYLVRDKKGFVPVLRHVDISGYLPMIENTLNFDMDTMMKNTGILGCDCLKSIKNVQGFIPKDWLFKSPSEKAGYIDKSTFRMTVTSFVDRFNFDMKSAQKECVHVITPHKKRIPFSMYNMVHRKRDE